MRDHSPQSSPPSTRPPRPPCDRAPAPPARSGAARSSITLPARNARPRRFYAPHAHAQNPELGHAQRMMDFHTTTARRTSASLSHMLRVHPARTPPRRQPARTACVARQEPMKLPCNTTHAHLHLPPPTPPATPHARDAMQKRERQLHAIPSSPATTAHDTACTRSATARSKPASVQCPICTISMCHPATHACTAQPLQPYPDTRPAPTGRDQ